MPNVPRSTETRCLLEAGLGESMGPFLNTRKLVCNTNMTENVNLVPLVPRGKYI